MSKRVELFKGLYHFSIILFLGFWGALIASVLITIPGLFKPFTNFQQFGLASLIYVGFLGPFLEELVRVFLSVKIKKRHILFFVALGLCWGISEEFIRVLQRTNFFSLSLPSIYNFQYLVALIGTILMHTSCMTVLGSKLYSMRVAFLWAFGIHCIHNASSLIITEFIGFSEIEKLLKIIIYLAIIVYICRRRTSLKSTH